MTLHPCAQCKRHIAERRCPFCGGTQMDRHDVPWATGRLSRAAVFAGALAAPACSGAGDPVPSPQPAVVATTPPRDAASPVDAVPIDAPAATTGSVTGTATMAADHRPVMRLFVALFGPPHADVAMKTTVTDEHGHYTFGDLPPGEYVVQWVADVLPRRATHPVAPSRKNATVTAGATTTVDLVVLHRADSPVVTPYGAPPARVRRV